MLKETTGRDVIIPVEAVEFGFVELTVTTCAAYAPMARVNVDTALPVESV
jgi:hypothetical protein